MAASAYSPEPVDVALTLPEVCPGRCVSVAIPGRGRYGRLTSCDSGRIGIRGGSARGREAAGPSGRWWYAAVRALIDADQGLNLASAERLRQHLSTGGDTARVRGDEPRERGGALAAATARDATTSDRTPGRRRTSATGTAEQLLLFVWGRLTLSGLKIGGDQRVFEQLIAWEPEEW